MYNVDNIYIYPGSGNRLYLERSFRKNIGLVKGLKSTIPGESSFHGLETSRVYKEKQREKKYTIMPSSSNSSEKSCGC